MRTLRTLYEMYRRNHCSHDIVIDIYASRHHKFAIKYCLKCDMMIDIVIREL